MSKPPESLLKYSDPVLLNDIKPPRGCPLSVSSEQHLDSGVPTPPHSVSKNEVGYKTGDILNTIFPPRMWKDGNQVWMQTVSHEPSTREEMANLVSELDTQLKDRQAREMDICPVRRGLYSQFFDELIRLVTIRSPESGWLLARVKNEIQVTIDAYETLGERATAFGMRKAMETEQMAKPEMEKRISNMETVNDGLKKQISKAKAECDAIKKKQAERRQLEEEKRTAEILVLKRSNQQVQTLLEDLRN